MKKFAITIGLFSALLGIVLFTPPAFGQSGWPAPQVAPNQLWPDQTSLYPWPLWHDSTSDAVLQDALPSSGRMFVLYYRNGDVRSAKQEMRVQEACYRQPWKDIVRYYKVDAAGDTDQSSHTSDQPTMIMVVPDPSGKLIVLNAAVGARSQAETYDFFVQSMKNPPVVKQPSVVIKANASDVACEIQRTQRPAVVLYYRSDSFLGLVEEQIFEQVSRAHAKEMSFMKIDVIQDEQGTTSLGGVPSVVVYQDNGRGEITATAQAIGFHDSVGMESVLPKPAVAQPVAP
jgi:hypothetical protein